MSSVVILEFPSNLGLKESVSGQEPGVKRLPEWLKKYKFHELIKPENTYTLDSLPYSMNLDKTSAVRNANNIVKYAKRQAKLLKKTLAKDKFALVIGGDCSVLIGNALALKETGNFALFFLDGHTDFMWPSLSQTGGAAGMDLAIVCGYGHDKLTNINVQKPYFREHHVWCVGNRDYEDWYVQAIENSEVVYIDLFKLRNYGIKNCVTDFLDMVTANNLDGFWIHIDVDVLNDKIMPAVDSRQAGGLHYKEFDEVLQLLLSDSKAIGLEITILDPDLDPTGRYTKEFVDNFCAAFNSATKNNR